MKAKEAGKVFTIFIELLKSMQTSVFLVNGEIDERLILRKTLPTHYAVCSWPIGVISGFFPYSLVLENQAIGCRHSFGITPTDLYVCIAAPHVQALQSALGYILETNDFFASPGALEVPKLSVWVKGPNGRNVEIREYQGQDLAQMDLN